jgi:hypothetical protein
MSEQLLDAAVDEAINEFELPDDHFLCCADNISAVKAMIRGDCSSVDATKKWLYSIVCNERSGELLWINSDRFFGGVYMI